MSLIRWEINSNKSKLTERKTKVLPKVKIKDLVRMQEIRGRTTREDDQSWILN